MIRSHKISLRPTENQKTELIRAFAASRHAWNFAKEILNSEYHIDRVAYREDSENYKLTHAKSIKKIYNRIKPDWVMGTGTATQEAFGDIEKAVRRYWDIRSSKIKQSTNGDSPFRRDGFRHGWLKWRAKGKHESFRQTYVSLKFDGKNVQYNHKVGFIRMSESLRFEGKPKSATFSHDGLHFWVSVNIEVDDSEMISYPKKGEFIGVDLGIKSFAKTSRPLRDESDEIENPRALKRNEAKLKRLSRKLDRQRRVNNPHYFDEKGRFKRGAGKLWVESNQTKRTRLAIKKLHVRIANIRGNTQHQLTSQLAKDFVHIGIEDLNIKGMLKNRKLAKHIADVGFSEIRRQFEYKSDLYGSEIVVVDRFYPSSKTCSGCAHIKSDMKLSDRLWICEGCGQTNDRDKNAAINLENEARRIVKNGDNGL